MTAAGDESEETGSTLDGTDVVDGGDGNDTISYEGEIAVVTVNLGTIKAAVEAMPDGDPVVLGASLLTLRPESVRTKMLLIADMDHG